MSGDNLLGEQPIKFYSKGMTETKMKLVLHYLKFMYHATQSLIQRGRTNNLTSYS